MAEHIDLDAERYVRDPQLQAFIAHFGCEDRKTVETLVKWAYQTGRLDGSIEATKEAAAKLEAIQ